MTKRKVGTRLNEKTIKQYKVMCLSHDLALEECYEFALNHLLNSIEEDNNLFNQLIKQSKIKGYYSDNDNTYYKKKGTA